jgi:hypothetical protein
MTARIYTAAEAAALADAATAPLAEEDSALMRAAHDLAASVVHHANEVDRLRTHNAQMAATLRLEADNIEARARRTPGEPTRSDLLRDAAAFRRLAGAGG